MATIEHFSVTESVALSDSAARYLSREFSQRGLTEKGGLSLSVQKKGCSGLMYVTKFVRRPPKHSIELAHQDVRIFLDKESLPLLAGMQIDLETDALNKKIKFVNPNATGTCGCGESFSVVEQ